MRRWFLICALFLLFPIHAHAATYYVSTSGNDSSSGTSQSAPWKTISKIENTSLQPGDLVLFRRGDSWQEQFTIENTQGTSNNPITFGAYGSGDRPRINGNGSLGSGGLVQFHNTHYIVFQDIYVTNSSTFGMYTSSSSHLTFQNCVTDNTQDGGIAFIGGLNGSGNINHITIDGCEVNRSNQRGGNANHEGISFENVDTFEVKNSHIHHCGEEGIDAKYGGRNGSIHHNLVHDNGGPNIYIDASHDIDVYNNVVYNSSSAKTGISINVESSYNPEHVTAYNVNVFNNVVYGNGGGMSFWMEGGATNFANYRNIKIINNTFYNNNTSSRGGIQFASGSSSNFTSGNVIRNNIFWDNGRAINDSVGATNSFTIDHNFFGSSETSSSFGDNSIRTTDNPFVSSGSDFHLNSSSQAINTGSSSNAPSFDLDDASRPAGSGFDIGAYEFGSSGGNSSPTPTPTSSQSTCPTDINRDGITDLSDYSILVSNFLSSNPNPARADISGDDLVDLSDYSLLVSSFLQSC